MPTVPRYQPQVTPQALPNARQQVAFDPKAYGQGVARGLNAVADVSADYAYDVQQRARKSRLLASQDQVNNIDFELFNAPETGALNRKGDQTFGLEEKVLPEFDKRISKLAEGINNPDERAAFDAYAGNVRNQRRGDMARLVVREGETFYKGQSAATIENASQLAAANYTNPKRLGDEMLRAEIAAELPLQGQAPGLVMAAQAEARGKVMSAVILREMDTDPLAADKRFREVRDTLPADQAESLERQLDGAVSQERGRISAGDIWSKSKGDRSAALGMLADIEDPKIRTAAKSELTARFAEITAAKTEAETGAKDAAWRLAVTGTPLSKMPANVINGLLAYSPETVSEIQTYEERGGKIDANTLALNYGRVAAMTDAELKDTKPVDLIPLLGTGPEYKRMADKINDLNNPNKSGAASFTQTQLNDQIEAASYNYPRFKVPTTGKGKGKRSVQQEQDYGRVRLAIDQEIEILKASGKTLDPKARDEIIDRHLMDDWKKNTILKVDPPGLGNSGYKPISQLTVEDVTQNDARISIKNIPDEDIAAARDQLRAKNITDSDANVSFYISALLAGGTDPNRNEQALRLVGEWVRGN